MDFTDLWTPSPKQRQFLDTVLLPQSKYILYGGAKFGGKSNALRWVSLYMLLRWASLGFRGVRVGLFCEDYPAVKDRQLTKIAQEFPSWLGTLGDNKIEGLSFILKPQFGSGVLALRNLDDPAKYASSEYALLAVDELTLNPESVFLQLRSIMRWPGIEDTKFIAGTNPIGIGMAWVKKLWITRDFPSNEKEADRFFFIPAKASDNPYKSSSYEDQLAGLSTNLRRAYLEGSWDVYEGQMFTEYDPALHVCDPFSIPAHWRKYRAVDHGRTAPTSCHWYAVDEKGGLWVYREYYRSATDADVNARNIAELSAEDLSDSRYWFTVLDSACWSKHGGETIAEIYEKNGVFAEPSGKDRGAGLALIHEYLRHRTPLSVFRSERLLKDGDPLPAGCELSSGFVEHPPKLHIFKTCTNLMREIQDAVIGQTRDGSPTELIDDRCSDHALDELSYGLMHMHEGSSRKKETFLEKLLRQRKDQSTISPANLNRFYANRMK